MLKDNIKILRNKNNMSQEQLAIKLNVVRQTVSKWEQGISVPDAEMLVLISNLFAIPVSVLLGENISKNKNDDIQAISKKLEIINNELLKTQKTRRKRKITILIIINIISVLIFIILLFLKSPYLKWNNNLEYAIIGANFHIFEWIYIRLFPFIFLGSLIGIYLLKKLNYFK